MAAVRGYLSGAKTLLAHFHFVNKGHIPFEPNFDWTSPVNKRMADLTDEQIRFVQGVADEATRNGVYH